MQDPLAEPWPDGRAGVARARFVGNCLAELDRFLHVLMDDLAPGKGLVARPDQRNAANKIGRLGGERDLLVRDQTRLRALGRSRACLSRCHGLVRRADERDGGWMTAGWFAPATTVLRRYPLGERLLPSGTDLAEVALFYERVAGGLVAEASDDQRRRVPG